MEKETRTTCITTAVKSSTTTKEEEESIATTMTSAVIASGITCITPVIACTIDETEEEEV